MDSKLVAFLAGALTLGLVNAASAADMAVKARPVIVDPAFGWSGWYVGANAGYGWGNQSVNFSGDPPKHNPPLRGDR